MMDYGDGLVYCGGVEGDRVALLHENAYQGNKLWGRGWHRATVVRIVEDSPEGRSVRWRWRAWSIAPPELNGTITNRAGLEETRGEAERRALEALEGMAVATLAAMGEARDLYDGVADGES